MSINHILKKATFSLLFCKQKKGGSPGLFDMQEEKVIGIGIGIGKNENVKRDLIVLLRRKGEGHPVSCSLSRFYYRHKGETILLGAGGALVIKLQ